MKRSALFLGLFAAPFLLANSAQAEPVILAVDVLIDQAAPNAPSHAGQHDRLHLVYDDATVDPATHRVKLLNLQHFIRGAFEPPHPDPVMMPTDDAWLDLSFSPYRLHFRANVVHGMPITIIADENTGRLTILSRQAPHAVIESGFYKIDPIAIRGKEAIAAGTMPDR